MHFETTRLRAAIDVARPLLVRNRSAGSQQLTIVTAMSIGIAGAGLRIWQARESLWLDELHTAWASGASFAEVASRAAIGNQSPLFFWLEWAVIQCLGSSEHSLRLLSIVAGALLPVVIFLVADRWAPRGTSLCAAALAAISPSLIYVATEARPYAVVQLLAVIHVWLTTMLIGAPRLHLRLAWIVIAAGLFYLHYTTALFLFAELVFLTVMWWWYPAKIAYRWTSLVVDMLLLGLLCLPAVGHLGLVFQRRANWAEFIQPSQPWAVFEWWPLSVGSLYLLVAAASARCIPPAPEREPRSPDRGNLLLVLTLCWFFVPAAIAWVLTATDVARLFFPRYLAASAPAAILLGAMSVELAPGEFSKRLLRGLLLAASGIFILAHFSYDGRFVGGRQDDWRSAVRWLNQQRSDPRSPILLASGLIEAEGLRMLHEPLLDNYCLLPITSVYRVAADRGDLFPLPLRNPGQLDGSIRSLVAERPGAWLIARIDRSTAQKMTHQVLSELNRVDPALQWRTVVSRSFGDVHVMGIASRTTDRQLVND